MRTFLLHHTPKSPNQDTWAVSFSLPYIATEYVRAGDGVWYVKSWLTAEQIARRLAVLFDDLSELQVHELARPDALELQSLSWLPGRLEDDEPVDLAGSLFNAPRLMREVVQSAFEALRGGTAQDLLKRAA